MLRFAEVVTASQTGGETSREVAKRPGIETSKGAKRPGGESSRWRTVQVAKRTVQVSNPLRETSRWQTGKVSNFPWILSGGCKLYSILQISQASSGIVFITWLPNLPGRWQMGYNRKVKVLVSGLSGGGKEVQIGHFCFIRSFTKCRMATKQIYL